jgi:hypothetical protein
MGINPTREELNTLAKGDLHSHVVALRTRRDGSSELINLPVRDINCWQLFLRFFGCGTLAQTDWSLERVCTHLALRNWKQYTSYQKDSPEYRAYYRICLLSNKAYRSREDRRLIETLSASVQKGIDFRQDLGHIKQRLLANEQLLWNPATTVRDIDAQLHRRYPHAVVKVKDASGGVLSPSAHVELERAEISVRQRLLPLTEGGGHAHHNIAIPQRR